jgi:hypothetical protein
MLPNIRDDTINSLIGLTQGSLSYADYNKQFQRFSLEVSATSYG